MNNNNNVNHSGIFFASRKACLTWNDVEKIWIDIITSRNITISNLNNIIQILITENRLFRTLIWYDSLAEYSEAEEFVNWIARRVWIGLSMSSHKPDMLPRHW